MIRQFFFVSVQVCGTRTRVSQLPKNYSFFTEMNGDATRTIAENNTYKAMEGYIEMGKYSKEQSDQLFSAGNYNSDYIRRIYGRQ